MELQQLRYVVEVADTLSFTRAAERCFVTQSALSHQIASLEREIGRRLFVRSSRSVRLSEAGQAFVEHARIALRAAERAKEDAAAVDGVVEGTLRIGVIPTVTAIDVPAVLVAYRAAHPRVRVELQVGNSDVLIRRLRQDELDIALLGLRDGLDPVGVASHALSRARLVAVFPRGHELALRSSIELEDIAGMTFADFPAATSGRAQSDAAFTAAGLTRDVAFEADSATLILGLVEAGLAVTLLAPGTVERSGFDVATAEVRGGPVRVEYLAWDIAAPRNVARAFVAIMEATDVVTSSP
ncbi:MULTISPECIES: LysR substrate-binding domain-containing protein [unclassified Microbacterium]|uniref:LysR family transcriptional regulator n=1 Tax=unclassified Microbacterium TaxID=2609290 RepID=UPI000CFCC291|nr:MULTISPECIES: LysR substrate-binding domain-containing protein [unclassified Microbacterium]PQZ61166.1 LysR family transcriptional regulator [Microbacterium sp. MYb43]PQZ82377.1 LysR family transcriptional regulator [Microbacterium sp. MYb40]PRB23924.1 LysR family transcriptional regulator [Microbacterium sp. MYb54]PRB30755.1 LysR family transcriptional regulator [Microbacterium sp. MYb50]PRB70824.1 LysR family transcriptional regulator [Microbacterium sp. MYb24]